MGVMSTSDWKFLGDSPGIPGLIFRPANLLVEKDQLLEVIEESCMADGIDHVSHWRSCDSIRVSDSVENQPVERVVAEIKGRIVGYADARSTDVEGSFHMDGHVLPDWRCCGIGSALLNHIETVCREWTLNSNIRKEAVVETCARGNMTGRRQLLQDFGYQIWRYRFEFVHPRLIEMPDLMRPAEFSITSLPITAVPQDFSAGTSAEENGVYLRTKNDPGKFDGVICSFSEEENRHFGRKRGYIRSFSADWQLQTQEETRALIRASLIHLQEAGMEEAVVAADVDVPEGDFNFGQFVGLGFHLENRLLMYRKII